MRVTEKSIFDGARRSSAGAAERHAKATELASSGLKVQRPWDSERAGTLLRERMLEASARGISESVARRSDEMGAVDRALGQALDTLTSTLQLAMQFSNDSYNADDRRNAVPEAQQRLNSLVATMNLDVGGRYVFGGTKDNAPPFDATGAYTGDTGVLQQEVAPGILQQVSVRADVALKGTNGGVDVMQAMNDLVTALGANDAGAIRSAIGALNSGIVQVATLRTEAGGIQSALDVAKAFQQDRADVASGRAHAISDADFIETATELAFAERGLDAALTASAKSFRLTLLDKI